MFNKILKLVGIESSEDRFMDKTIYEIVGKEIREGYKDEGLSVKAQADSGGDSKKAESLYLKYRAEMVRDEIVLEHRKVKQNIQKQKKIEYQEVERCRKEEERVMKEILKEEAQKRFRKIIIFAIISFTIAIAVSSFL